MKVEIVTTVTIVIIVTIPDETIRGCGGTQGSL